MCLSYGTHREEGHARHRQPRGPGAHQMEGKELIKDGLIMMSSLINSFLYTALTFLEGNASCVEKAIALTLTASVEDTFNP